MNNNIFLYPLWEINYTNWIRAISLAEIKQFITFHYSEIIPTYSFWFYRNLYNLAITIFKSRKLNIRYIKKVIVLFLIAFHDLFFTTYNYMSEIIYKLISFIAFNMTIFWLESDLVLNYSDGNLWSVTFEYNTFILLFSLKVMINWSQNCLSGLEWMKALFYC